MLARRSGREACVPFWAGLLAFRLWGRSLVVFGVGRGRGEGGVGEEGVVAFGVIGGEEGSE